MNRLSAIAVVILLAVVGVLSWMLLVKNASEPGHETTSWQTNTESPPPSSSSSDTPQPLSTKVVVITPKENDSVSKTFTVTGEAPGPWYFEASFPVQVRDKDGNILASVPAQAEGDWMTDKQVPFKATLKVETYAGPATLILLKDNPSGMPENDDSVSFPITIQ